MPYRKPAIRSTRTVGCTPRNASRRPGAPLAPVASPEADPETLDFVDCPKSDEAQECFEAEGMFR